MMKYLHVKEYNDKNDIQISFSVCFRLVTNELELAQETIGKRDTQMRGSIDQTPSASRLRISASLYKNMHYASKYDLIRSKYV